MPLEYEEELDLLEPVNIPVLPPKSRTPMKGKLSRYDTIIIDPVVTPPRSRTPKKHLDKNALIRRIRAAALVSEDPKEQKIGKLLVPKTDHNHSFQAWIAYTAIAMAFNVMEGK